MAQIYHSGSFCSADVEKRRTSLHLRLAPDQIACSLRKHDESDGGAIVNFYCNATMLKTFGFVLVEGGLDGVACVVQGQHAATVVLTI